MSNLEHDSLVSKIEQLERQQQVLTKYIATTKRQLDELSEQFNNRPELEQLAELKDVLARANQQLDNSASLEVPVEVVSETAEESQQQLAQACSSEYHLVFDRSGSRAVLLEALEQAQERLIIVCPWLNRNSIDADLMQKFRDCLKRNCRIEIGWGHLSDRTRIGIGWRYNALPELRQMEQDYPGFFSLKLLGTHEKFLVCDSTFAMLGSYNLLTSSAQSAEREVGIRTTDSYIIQGLIDRFDAAEVQDAQAIVDSLTEDSISFGNAEVIEVQDTSEKPDAILGNFGAGATDQNLDTSDENEQEAVLDVEEFLRRYEAGEKDFTRINLSGANLSGKSLKSDSDSSKAVNLIKANLSGTTLTKANLQFVRLLQANLNRANLSEAYLYGTNFTAADLSGATLIQANLQYANLTAADLSEAILVQADLGYANLLAANLSKAKLRSANLSNANLSSANLSKAQLGNTKFTNANLSGANLTGANLVGVDFGGIKLGGITLSGANLCGANLSYQNLGGANLGTADLRGANLSNALLEKANLEKANLKGANLAGAALTGANLSGAIMPDGTIQN